MNAIEKIKSLEQDRKGYLNPLPVKACTFYTVRTCIGLSTITAILAIIAVVNTWFGTEGQGG